MTEDDPWRAVRSPFELPQDWAPDEGTCSRCGEPAVRNDGLWWHDGRSCNLKAEFIPDSE